MGNCVTSSAKVRQNNQKKAKTSVTIKKNDSVRPSATTLSHSRELLQIAEPSDGSFALFYPELKLSSEKIPNNGTMDRSNTASSRIAEKVRASFISESDRSDSLQIAEPSDGSFALFYPELKLSSEKVPSSKGTMDLPTSALPGIVEKVAPSRRATPPTKRGQAPLTESGRSDSLQIAEPSDGSFRLFYPELKLSSEKIPSNGSMDRPNTASSAIVQEVLPRQTLVPTNRGQTSVTESETSSESSPLSNAAPPTSSVAIPIPMYAREA